MPEIYVHAVEGRTLDQKRALVKDITDAVVRHFAVPADAVMVQIMESPNTDKPQHITPYRLNGLVGIIGGDSLANSSFVLSQSLGPLALIGN